MKQQTAIDWLHEIISVHLSHEQLMRFEGLFQQAKQMEKEHIIQAYLEGADYTNDDHVTLAAKFYNNKYQNK